MLAILAEIASWLLGKIFGSKKAEDTARELGRVEQQAADMKEDVPLIKRANEAAKKVEQEEGRDPNDRDNG